MKELYSKGGQIEERRWTLSGDILTHRADTRFVRGEHRYAEADHRINHRVRDNMKRPGSVGSAQDGEWVQAVLEAEVDALLGRRKSERRQAVDSALGYRSGQLHDTGSRVQRFGRSMACTIMTASATNCHAPSVCIYVCIHPSPRSVLWTRWVWIRSSAKSLQATLVIPGLISKTSWTLWLTRRTCLGPTDQHVVS